MTYEQYQSGRKKKGNYIHEYSSTENKGEA